MTDSPFFKTSIFDHIEVNGRISKKLFSKIIIPKLEELDLLKKELDLEKERANNLKSALETANLFSFGHHSNCDSYLPNKEGEYGECDCGTARVASAIQKAIKIDEELFDSSKSDRVRENNQKRTFYVVYYFLTPSGEHGSGSQYREIEGMFNMDKLEKIKSQIMKESGYSEIIITNTTELEE